MFGVVEMVEMADRESLVDRDQEELNQESRTQGDMYPTWPPSESRAAPYRLGVLGLWGSNNNTLFM